MYIQYPSDARYIECAFRTHFTCEMQYTLPDRHYIRTCNMYKHNMVCMNKQVCALRASVRMYIYVYTYLCLCTCSYTCNKHTLMPTHTYMHAYMYIYTYTAHAYIHTHVCVSVHAHMYIYMRVYMYMYYTQKEALTPTCTKVRACYQAVLLPMFCGVLTNTYMCFTRHEMGVSEIYPISYYRGDSVVRQSGQLAAVVWMDNKQVVVMSTNVQPHEISTVRRMQSDATVHDVAAPMSIVSYNKWMGGVDRGDQMRQYYHLRLKSRKFYKYIFWFLVNVCIANSYIIHKNIITHL